ncbi:hypothetical protein BVX98_05150 [bacterium F11]|nr:hypothetical protein BVX98_05150 [bacterium F11]
MTILPSIKDIRQSLNFLVLRRFLQRQSYWPFYKERKFHPVDMFLVHLFSIVAELGKIENTQSLKLNGLFLQLPDPPDFPHRDTLRTFLWRFTHKELQNLQQDHNQYSLLNHIIHHRMTNPLQNDYQIHIGMVNQNRHPFPIPSDST